VTGAKAVIVDDRLITAKLSSPQVPRQHVDRPRLHAALDLGTTGPVTLVVAGAGWGKTLLAASWAARADLKTYIAWVTLDADDDEPRAFWTYVLAALRRSGAVRPDSPLASLDPAGGLSPDALRQIQVGLSELAHEVVLVIDDVSEVPTADVREQMALLFRHESPLRVVLLSRTAPRLPLHRLRVSGGVTEVLPGDLAFTPGEATELLVRHGLDVGADEVLQLLERTDGWPAGLRLAAMFLQRPGAVLADFGGADRAVTDYLMGEVVAGHSARTWEFLLATSVVARVSGDLADALTGQSRGQSHLDALERDNAFVTTFGPERRWYRYHPLLRDMLRRQILMEDPERVRSLHQAAATWFAGNDQPIDAVRHAVAGRHWALAGTLLTTVAAHRMLTIDRHALGTILAQIPAVELGRSPELSMCAVAVCFIEGRYGAISAHLTEARALLDEQGADADPSTRVLASLFEGVVGRAQGAPAEVVEATSSALATLDKHGAAVPLAGQLRALALGNRGVGQLWQDALPAATSSLEAGLAASEAVGIELSQVNCLGHLGLACVAVGHLRQGAAWAERSHVLAEARGWTQLPQAATGYLSQALIALQRNRLDAAEEHIARGLATQRSEAEPLAQLSLQVTQAAVDIASGRLAVGLARVDEVRDRFGRAEVPALARQLLLSTQLAAELATGDAARVRVQLEQLAAAERSDEETLLLVRARLATGADDGLAALLAPVVQRPRTDGLAVRSAVVQALLADRLRADGDALRALQRAVSCAEPEQVVAPFLGPGTSRLHGMLERLLVLRPDRSDFVRALLVARSSGPDASGVQARSTETAEPLTEREKTVLRYLAAMLTNAEIAEQMFLSPNTIKVHVRHVYSKLGVTSRRAAVRRGLELHLLDDASGMSRSSSRPGVDA
jgi:LuxR family maltose regulon positive regulatory protein